MSKENHDKFIQEIRDIRMKIGDLEDLIQEKTNNRNILDHLYVDEETVINLNKDAENVIKHEYKVYAPSPEGSTLATYNIVEICQMTKVNRKSLKKVWVDQLGGKLAEMYHGETVNFATKAAAEMALDWLISRITIKELSK